VYRDTYGLFGYTKLLAEQEEKVRDKAQLEKADLLNEINKANQAMISRAAENFARGIVKPTAPKKEIIMSGAGLSNKSKIIRDLTDREGGLILPDGYGEE
jgi:accessory colonization factor AcfC